MFYLILEVVRCFDNVQGFEGRGKCKVISYIDVFLVRCGSNDKVIETQLRWFDNLHEMLMALANVSFYIDGFLVRCGSNDKVIETQLRWFDNLHEMLMGPGKCKMVF